MSTADEHGEILQLMAEYDFKSPINSTIFICDSDENVNSSTEADPNHDSEKNNDVLKGTTSTETGLSSDITKFDESKTRGQTFLNITEPGSSNRAEELMRNNNNDANLRCDKTIPRCDKNKIINQEDKNPNRNNQITITTSLQSRSESRLGGEPHTPLPNDQVDANKANECVQTLLNIISEHIIFVLKAYMDYKAFTRTISDIIVLENARKQLQNTKYKLFHMSCSAVANIMLPKEKDKPFMQSFIDQTVKIGQSRHLFFKHSDIALVCEEMFGWVKTHNKQPLLVGLLNRESTAITSNTNNLRDPVGCDKANNASGSTYCIFTSGPTSREVTIHASADIQNSPNVQNVLVKQGAHPTSDGLRTNAKSTNCISNSSAQNASLMQSSLAPTVQLTTNTNSVVGKSNYAEQKMSSMHSVLATPSVKLSNNANLINCICNYTEQNNSSSTQSKPCGTLGTNINLTNYLSQFPVQNVEPRQSLPTPIELMKINANSPYYATSHSHAQNVDLIAQPASDKFRSTNSSNNISHYPVQNIPRQSVLATPPYRDELRKNATSTNYLQEFEHFNTNYSYYQSAYKNKSKQQQSNNRRSQRETYHHSRHTPLTSRPPPAYHSTQTPHRDTETTQNYLQNQYVNSTRCDNTQVVQDTVEVNRSLSRDSGIMSPVTCAPQDPMYNSPRYDQMDPSSTPMITHVTSLNPSVAYIEDGMCHVCGKITKDKCLACVKTYYCSQQCQGDDWKNHIYTCNL